MKIDQKKVILCQVADTLGLVLAVVFGFVAAVFGTWWGFVLFFVSLATSVAGNLLRGWLYRCPRCGKILLQRKYFRPFYTARIYDHCPGCGWRVIIED